MEVKIKGFVIALPPLSSPSYLLQWFIDWRMTQILAPYLLRFEEAARRAAAAVEGFAAAYRAALEEIGSELLEEIESESGEEW